MTVYDCDAIRDLLPSLVRGEMLPHEAASAEQHLGSCGGCRGEAELVRLLQEALTPLPPRLEERVLAAVRRRASPRRVPVRLALAASVAVALLGGAFAVTWLGDGADASDPLDTATLSWAAAEDPLLHGQSELHDLSIEELEVLLSELER